jgi:hypothetical protein
MIAHTPARGRGGVGGGGWGGGGGRRWARALPGTGEKMAQAASQQQPAASQASVNQEATHEPRSEACDVDCAWASFSSPWLIS